MTKPKVISLFSGAGGLDYGFEAAGFETAVALEMDHACCETLRENRPSWTVMETDILKVRGKDVLKAAGLKIGEADVLIGGPPCQPFSKAGYWARGDALRLSDPRAATLAAYLRMLEQTKPRAFLLENVEGLAYRGKDEGLRLLLDEIEAINGRIGTKYRPVFHVVNAASYGVPQLRKRLIMVGARDGKVFNVPSPTHRVSVTESDPADVHLAPPHTAWDALGDLVLAPEEDVAATGHWADLLPSIPEGSNYLWHTDRGGGVPLFGWRRRYWSFLLKLAKNQPSWTVQAQPGPAIGPFHWDNRRLSMRELCRIQTFPDDVVVRGSRHVVQKQIGNAVPSLLAEVFARAIGAQLLGMRSSEKPLLMPPRREPSEASRPTRRIPAKYKVLVGNDSAHPGPGQGRGALAARGARQADRLQDLPMV
ncbi:DNA cytosine methyltransferase [Myxococcus sp. AB036A]|uniref:DNA cytosine methyltransferase n=1 Tax=Myxococcus sp. AB036A TaxID=2562793 RepID=UPI0011466268|nr:DNA cytosine methyltransferase [Myxococcus sp. AB036A]